MTAAVTYQVLRSTLQARLLGRALTYETRNPVHILTPSEEETLVQHILDLDPRGFPPWFDYVRDMASLLLATRHAPPVGKQWPYNFVQRRTELKTRFSRAYDF